MALSATFNILGENKQMKFLLPVALAFFSVTAANAQSGSLSGEWHVEMDNAGSSSAQTCTFAQTAAAITGTCTSKAGAVPVSGSVQGKTVTWTMKTPSMVGLVTTVYNGSLDSANRINGVILAPEFKMESDFHATRYQLVWSDEFNTDGRPDPKRWAYETGFIRNNELQLYQPENAFCKDGLLIIEARRERKVNPNYEAGSQDWTKNRPQAEYTSASLTTRGITNWKYGRIEMRGRFDGRAGLWPEFWMMGDRDWPWNGEIDILESWQGMLNANVIWAGKTPGYSKASSQRRPIASFGDPAWTSKFHTWRLDWDENHIAIFVDDMLLNEVQINKAANGDGSNGFKDPHYMILNLAVGGTAGGDPFATQFPARFEVDWVRVYQ